MPPSPRRRRAAALALLAGLLLTSPPSQAWEAVPWRLRTGLAPGAEHQGVRFLGALELPYTEVDGIALTGMSGLAWDADEQRLYALSDRGALFHLRLHFEDAVLADVDILAAHRLQDTGGRPLEGSASDAEGLAVLQAANGRPGDTRLLVSFEQRARVVEYRTDGSLVTNHPLPAAIDERRFVSTNRGLESVTMDAAGTVWVAPERPPRGSPAGQVPLYALDGRRLAYPLADDDAAVVAIDFLADGRLLVLERDLDLMLFRLTTRLRLAWGFDGSGKSGGDGNDDSDRGGDTLRAKDLAVFDTPSGWRIDNFEGLALLEGERLLLVSDDNRHVLQHTVLLLLERLPGRDGRSRKFEPVQGRRD